MERLTISDDLGNWRLKGVSWQQLTSGTVITHETEEKIYGALCKLKEYEETGLTPEKLREIDKAYTQQAKELGQCKAEYDRGYNDGLKRVIQILERNNK